MFRVIWQFLRNENSRRRFGIDNADIRHIRADLRFRLALVEYAYFGRSGRRVASSLAELKSLLGEKAMHRYLKSLDPDLRTQFVERFQSSRRDNQTGAPAGPASGQTRVQPAVPTREAVIQSTADANNMGSNVVPFRSGMGRDPQPDIASGAVESGKSDPVQDPDGALSDSGERRDDPTAG